jgi:uncharacterized ParB-like nuclease family protein
VAGSSPHSLGSMYVPRPPAACGLRSGTARGCGGDDSDVAEVQWGGSAFYYFFKNICPMSNAALSKSSPSVGRLVDTQQPFFAESLFP